MPQPPRNARSRPDTKTELAFVNVTPGSQDEKVETRAIIRANAAHFHWRYNRPPKVGPEPSQLRHGARRLKNTQLGCELVDPFSSYGTKLPRSLVSRCMTYYARIILPSLFPDSADIRTNMLQLSMSHPPMLHALMIGAITHSHGPPGLSLGGPITPNVFKFRAEIVRHMSIAIKDPVEACKDINILAISNLAHNDHFERSSMPLKVPKQGPLRSLQLLDACGLTESVPVHVDGLWKLIELKGGLGKIEIPGFAAIISFTGLRVGTRDLTVPCYPVVTLSCPVEQFRFQHQEFHFDTDPDLNKALSMLKSYTMMIDDFCQGRNIVTASALIDHRNMTQHALLSLPSRIGSSECYRLAALIYSLLVTFPLPHIVAPFQRLVKELRLALAEWDGGNHMLIWVLTMGGIGAIGFNEREWFAKTFRGEAARIGIGSWDEARELLQMGLWLGETNDIDGKEFWLDSQSV